MILALLLEAQGVEQFSMYAPISLRPGEVHNKGLAPQNLPPEIVRRFAGRKIAIVGYDSDIVRFEGTEEVRVPLTEMYNHHQYLVLGTNETVNRVNQFYHDIRKGHAPITPCGLHASMHHGRLGLGGTNFGGGPGGEMRKTSHHLAAPYRLVVESPESFITFLHFINTRGLDGKKIIECPCTSARHINVSNGTIDGFPPDPFYCNKGMENNTACSLATYKGGLRCCMDGVFVTESPDLEAPADRVFAKFTFHFEDATPETQAADIAGCCDVVGDLNNLGENYEYDIPLCDPTSRPNCVHKATTVQMVDKFMRQPADPAWNHTPGAMSDLIDLVWAYGHQHIGGLGTEIYDDSTGELLCSSKPIYGRGEGPGNEDGYVVGLTSCAWGPPPLRPPPRMRRDNKLRIVGLYNSSQAHIGVMTQWQILKVDVEPTIVI